MAFFIIEGHADSIFKVFSAVSIAARVFSIALHKAKGALLPLFLLLLLVLLVCRLLDVVLFHLTLGPCGTQVKGFFNYVEEEGENQVA